MFVKMILTGILLCISYQDIKKREIDFYLILSFLIVSVIGFAIREKLAYAITDEKIKIIIIYGVMGVAFGLLAYALESFRGDCLLIYGICCNGGIVSAIYVIFVAFFMAMLLGVWLLCLGRKGEYKLPFAPPLLISFLIIEIVGKLLI